MIPPLRSRARSADAAPTLRARSLILAVLLEGGALAGAAFLPTHAAEQPPLRLTIESVLADPSEAVPEQEREEREVIEEPSPIADAAELPEPSPAPLARFEPKPEPKEPLEPMESLDDPLARHALDALRPRKTSEDVAKPVETAIAKAELAKAELAKPKRQPEEAKPEPAPPSVASLPELLEGHNKPPRYPSRARRLLLEGVVHLELAVDARGHVVEAKIKRSSGSRLLDRAAERAVLKWRYSRGPARFPWQVEFRLNAEE